MENEELELEKPEQQEKEPYTPRPKWQVVGAWIALALLIVGNILYYWHIASGGMLR